MDVLHLHVDLVAAGAAAEQRYPGVAAHLRACGPCGEDFEGLPSSAFPADRPCWCWPTRAKARLSPDTPALDRITRIMPMSRRTPDQRGPNTR